MLHFGISKQRNSMLGAIKNIKKKKKNGEHVFVAKETCQDTTYMPGPKPSDHNLDML